MFGRGRGAPPAESHTHTHTHTQAVQMWSDTRQPFLSRYDERLQQEAGELTHSPIHGQVKRLFVTYLQQ